MNSLGDCMCISCHFQWGLSLPPLLHCSQMLANLDKRASSIKHRVFPGLLQNRQLASCLAVFLSEMVIHCDVSLG